MADIPAKTIDNKWILSQRGEKHKVDPFTPYAFIVEKEYSISGRPEDVATIFLSNSECPFKCLMCDLWKNTTDQPVPEGAIPQQIRHALNALAPANHLKLYNSGNFFDRKAIPITDYSAIATLVDPFETVTVECHPKLIGRHCIDFNESISPQLQVAIGLETIHPGSIDLLNKQMSLADFRKAVEYLNKHHIPVRTFILLGLPYLSIDESIHWARKSLEFAFECGVECCAVIPTRTGNGAMDWFRDHGHFSEPDIKALESVLKYGLQLKAGRVFADLWDLERFADCPHCYETRYERLNMMNLSQTIVDPVQCTFCPS